MFKTGEAELNQSFNGKVIIIYVSCRNDLVN